MVGDDCLVSEHRRVVDGFIEDAAAVLTVGVSQAASTLAAEHR